MGGRLGARIVTGREPDYPARLADHAHPPPVLEIAGASAPLFRTATAEPPSAVAIVGSRHATPYGLEVAFWLARELALQGVVVISGFARGIDAAAHQGALAAEHGRTVGVLGCGLSCDYPKGHRELGERIRARGALVSEFPCALRPSPGNFPVRNRIIAALAEITIVVEAAARSGSLITARLALELGREVACRLERREDGGLGRREVRGDRREERKGRGWSAPGGSSRGDSATSYRRAVPGAPVRRRPQIRTYSSIRPVDFDDTPPEAAFRAEARAWLETHAPAKGSPDDFSTGMLEGTMDPEEFMQRVKAWQRLLVDEGWAGITWPKAYGGRGGTSLQSSIFTQESSRFGVATTTYAVGTSRPAATNRITLAPSVVWC